jgi:hypothetical protein
MKSLKHNQNDKLSKAQQNKSQPLQEEAFTQLIPTSSLPQPTKITATINQLPKNKNNLTTV